MEAEPVSNNTRPKEGTGNPLRDFKKGHQVFVETHTVSVHGIKFEQGGFSGNFVKNFYGPNGDAYTTIYCDGFRTFDSAMIRDIKEASESAMVFGHAKNGKVSIKCIGLENQPCEEIREIHGSDKHLVKRCKNCQSKYAKIANRERMRKRRAEKKALKDAIKKKEMGRDS